MEVNLPMFSTMQTILYCVWQGKTPVSRLKPNTVEVDAPEFDAVFFVFLGPIKTAVPLK